MADLGTDLAIHLRVITDGLRSGFAQAESAATQWANNTVAQVRSVESSGNKLGGVFTAMAEAFAAEKIVHGLSEMVGAAAKAATAMDTTAQIARNLGHAFDENTAEKFLDQLATSAAGSIAPIEALRAGMQRLSMVTSTQEQMERALAIATNLAAARHIDVGTAVNIVTRVLTGHVALLGRYGIATKDAAGHTLTASQMMERLATATAGAAAKLNPYERAQGELRNSLALLSETIGKMLLPVFTALVDKLVVVVNWFRGLSPEALKVVGVIAGVVAAFTGLLAAATAIVSVAPAIATAWGVIMGPIGGVIAAIAALIAIIVGVVTHWGQLRSATASAWQYIQAVIGAASSYIHQIFAGIADLLGLHTRSWGTFRSDVGGIVGSLVGWIETQFNRFDPMFAAVHALWDGLVSKVHGAASAIIRIIESMMSAIGGAFTRIGAFFHGLYEKLPENMRKGIGEVASGLHGLANLGESVGAKLGGGIRAGLAGVANFVGGIFYHHLVSTDAPKVPGARFPDAPGSGAGHAGRGGAGRAGGAGRERRGRQQHAARGSAPHDEFFVPLPPRAGSPSKYASYDEQMAGLKSGAGYKIGLLPDQSKSIHDADVTKTAPLIAELKAQIEDIRHKEAMQKAGGTLTPDQSAQYARETAAREHEIDVIEADNARKELIYAQAVARADRSDKAQEKLNTATATYNASIEKLTKSTDTLAELNVKAGEKIGENAKNFTDFLGQLIRKIPGLTEKKDPTTGAFSGVSFNPWAVFLEAIQNTKAFGDIMKTVGDIMKVIAQVFDAFRPVIDLLLRAVRMVVNGFIGIWNAIAHILRLFGIHVPLLQKLTDDLTGVANQNKNTPLIQITHDLPTLNELATGKIKPLSPQPHDYSSLASVQQPTIDALKDPGLGGGILGVLGSILAGILSLKLIMGLFGGGGGGGLLGHLFGGGGGGILKGVEGFLGSHLGIGIGATIGSTLLAAVGGAALGGALFGNKGDSSIGGGIGGAAGAIFGGPIGAIIGSVLGSAIGSLFGGKKANEHTNPDQFHSADLGNMVMNFQADTGGTGTFGNEHIKADPAMSAATDHKGVLEYLKEKTAGMSTAALKAMFGADTTSIMDLLKRWNPAQSFTQGKDGSYNIGGENLRWDEIMRRGNAAWADWQKAIISGTSDLTANLFGGAVRVVQTLQSLNDLASGIAAGVGTAASSGAPPNGLAAAAGAGPQVTPGLGGPMAAAAITIVQNNDFNGAHMHGIDDIREIGKALADEANRAARMNAYDLTRGGWT